MADPAVGEQRTFNGQLAEWDGKGWRPVSKSAPARTWTDTAVDALPAVGGMVGGALGGAAGALPTLGLGGVPGAMVGAGVLGAGGEAAKQLINRARGLQAPSSAGEAATAIGEQGALQGGLEGAGRAVMGTVTPVAEAVYRGYLKPSLSKVNLPKAAQIVKDAIAENLPVTPGGALRAQELIGQLNGKVNDLLSQATGKTVNLSEIADGVRGWAKRMYDRPGRDPNDYKAVLKVADRIDQHTPVNPFDPAQPAEATMPAGNQIKQDLQSSVGDKFGVPNGKAETAGEKYASAQMRKGIEAHVPDVAPLNARQSRLIDVARNLNNAVAREGNQQAMYGVKSMVAGTLGTAAGGSDYYQKRDPLAAAATGAVTALVSRMALTPAVATRAAILATKMAEKIPGTAVADLARVAVQVASEAQEQ